MQYSFMGLVNSNSSYKLEYAGGNDTLSPEKNEGRVYLKRTNIACIFHSPKRERKYKKNAKGKGNKKALLIPRKKSF